MIWALSMVGREEIRGVGSRGQSGGQEAAVEALAAFGAVRQEAELSKSPRQLPAKRRPHRRPRAGPGQAGWPRTHLVAKAGVGGRHGCVEHVHLLQLHVAVELLQLRGLHALQLREVVLGEGLELAVHVVRVEVPVMVWGAGQERLMLIKE